MKRRTRVFLSIFLFGFLVPFCVFADSNNISSLLFTTDSQSVVTNTLSQALTVQTENAAGTAEKVSETNDVTFTSTSVTGKFLNSSGGAVSTTMSTNTASRTFYYEDSTAGTYTITVTIKGRTSGKTFSATQTITVTGNNSSSSDNSNASADDSTASSTSDNSSSDSDNDSTYSYSSQATIYGGQEDEPFNVTIGRNRLATVGEPVTFQAKMIPADSSYSGASFHFSFGDGTEWNGMLAKHTYEYPGEYVVILDATRYSDEAVAQVKVKVVSADLSLQNVANDSVTIKNNGSDEINIGGWTLSDNLGGFTVPEDTIVEGILTSQYQRA